MYAHSDNKNQIAKSKFKLRRYYALFGPKNIGNQVYNTLKCVKN